MESNVNIPYRLNSPDHVFELPEKLNEISGLDFWDDSTLMCVQDEKAVVYFLDRGSGEIVDHYDFGKNADFEGVARFENKIYALKSNGSITRISQTKKEKSYKFDHGKGYDYEGLCADTKRNRLLIACKEHPNKDKDKDIHIYAFDLDEKEFKNKPILKIPKSKVAKDFRPSGIAIHPNGEIYILSSTARMLLVVSMDGTIVSINNLSPSLFNQPEGITFGKDGDLYISNEKRNTRPSILRFEMKK